MLHDFIRDGGFGMYPTLLFGGLSVAAALVLALKPERRFVPLLLALGATTGASGVLGTAMGFISSLRAVANLESPDRLTLLMLGAAESLNNLVLALACTVLAALVASVAAARVALSRRAEA